MAYGRNTNHALWMINAGAAVFRAWWVLLIVLLLVPFGPKVLVSYGYGACTYHDGSTDHPGTKPCAYVAMK